MARFLAVIFRRRVSGDLDLRRGRFWQILSGERCGRLCEAKGFGSSEVGEVRIAGRFAGSRVGGRFGGWLAVRKKEPPDILSFSTILRLTPRWSQPALRLEFWIEP